MFVECKSICGKDVPIESRFVGDSDDSSYEPLVPSGIYAVSALLIYKNRLDYLISVNGQSPSWFPSSLFFTQDSSIDANLRFVDLTTISDYSWLCENFGARYMIGYSELTESFAHFTGLLERNFEALSIFFERQKNLEF